MLRAQPANTNQRKCGIATLIWNQKKKPNIKQKAIGYRDIFNSRWNNSQKRYNNHEFV